MQVKRTDISSSPSSVNQLKTSPTNARKGHNKSWCSQVIRTKPQYYSTTKTQFIRMHEFGRSFGFVFRGLECGHQQLWGNGVAKNNSRRCVGCPCIIQILLNNNLRLFPDHTPKIENDFPLLDESLPFAISTSTRASTNDGRSSEWPLCSFLSDCSKFNEYFSCFCFFVFFFSHSNWRIIAYDLFDRMDDRVYR